MKIDREKFLALAVGAVCAAGCYVQEAPANRPPPPAQPPPAQPVAQQAPAPAPAPGTPAATPGTPATAAPGQPFPFPPGFQPPPGWKPPAGMTWPAPANEGGATPAPAKE
jgi:hypothetical protein